MFYSSLKKKKISSLLSSTDVFFDREKWRDILSNKRFSIWSTLRITILCISILLHPTSFWTMVVLWFVPQGCLEKLDTSLEPQTCSHSLWMTSPRHQTQIFLQSRKMQIAASECCSNEKSLGVPEGCICGLVTPENPVARETVFAKKVVSHAAGLLLPSDIGSKSVTGEPLWCKADKPDHKTRSES